MIYIQLDGVHWKRSDNWLLVKETGLYAWFGIEQAA
jgi:hypothetical protein